MLTDYPAFLNQEILDFSPYASHGKNLLGVCNFKRRAEAELLFPYPLLIYVYSGKKVITIDKDNYVLSAGEGILIPKNTFFFCDVLWQDGQLRCINIALSPEVFSGYALFLNATNQLDVVSPIVIRNQFVTAYFSAFSALLKNNHFPDAYFDFKLYELLSLLSVTVPPENFVREGVQLSDSTKMYSLLSHKFDANISLDQLASNAGVSLSTFKREFKKRFDSSARQYIIKTRLNKASKLLLYSDKSIKEVAFTCGFNDPSYFIKMFKRYFGATPEGYRRLVR